MKNFNFYIKNLSLFLSLELFLVLIFSLLNLFGVNSSISSIGIFLFNIFLYILFGYVNGKKLNKKGYITGLLTGLSLSIIMFILTISFYKGNFNINTVLYYTILIFSSTFGAMLGKANKLKND